MLKLNNINIKFSLSFVLFSVAIIFFGNSFIFLIYMVSIFFHEMAHSLMSEHFGIKMKGIKVYPFGAVLYGDLEMLTPAQEILVAVIGPLFNVVNAVCCVALWWIIPSTYAYTDVIALSNLSLALFNLLPVYPLDGGKIFYRLLGFKINHIKAFKIVRLLGILTAVVFMGLYIVSAFYSINYYLMTASILLIWSNIDYKNEILFKNAVSSNFNLHNLEQGVNVRHIIVSENLTLFKLIKLINPNYYYIIDICGENLKTIKTIEHRDLEQIVVNNDIGTALNNIK